MEINNYNYSLQSPVSSHQNSEHKDADDLYGEFSETDLSGANHSQFESNKRSLSSATMEPLQSSISNNISPSPTDSPLFTDSHNEQFLNNHYFDDRNVESNNDSDNLLELTPDQVQVFKELELRKQEVNYDDDYEFGLNYDDMPEYDVRAKIQTLNAQLADEPFPPDVGHRNSKVVFREDIVSLVIPAENDGLSESEPEDPSSNTELSGQSPLKVASDNTYSPLVSLSDETVSEEHTKKTTLEESEKNEIENPELNSNKIEEPILVMKENQQAESTDGTIHYEDMVVSRGGEFHLMGTGDIIDGSNQYSKNEDEYSANTGDVNRSKNRPVSASASKRNLKSNGLDLDTGSSTKSDKTSRSNSLSQKSNDKSKLQIPRVDKEALRRQQERKKKEEEENQKREEEEQRMRKEMNTKSFNAWLQAKQKQRKEEDDRKKKEDEEDKERKEKLQDERKVIAEEKEKELAKKFENEKKKEEKLRQYRLKEMEDSMIYHSKAECKKAYKEWLKKKHKDHQSKVKEDRQRARITRLAMRQCRKSQDLAQAIQQSSSFRYLDFCGYP